MGKMNTQQLSEKLKTFDIPELRRDLSDFGNVCWLIRNLGIRNSGNSELQTVIKELVNLRKEMTK